MAVHDWWFTRCKWSADEAFDFVVSPIRCLSALKVVQGRCRLENLHHKFGGYPRACSLAVNKDRSAEPPPCPTYPGREGVHSSIGSHFLTDHAPLYTTIGLSLLTIRVSSASARNTFPTSL